jgi:hypothetical protein
VALTREQIKAKRGVRPRVPVEVPELGTVYVAKMTAKDRDAFEQMVTGGKVGGVNLTNIRARFVALVCVNEDGTKMFNPAETGMLRQEYAKVDLQQMMIALIDNGGVLASEGTMSRRNKANVIVVSELSTKYAATRMYSKACRTKRVIKKIAIRPLGLTTTYAQAREIP